GVADGTGRPHAEGGEVRATAVAVVQWILRRSGRDPGSVSRSVFGRRKAVVPDLPGGTAARRARGGAVADDRPSAADSEPEGDDRTADPLGEAGCGCGQRTGEGGQEQRRSGYPGAAGYDGPVRLGSG